MLTVLPGTAPSARTKKPFWDIGPYILKNLKDHVDMYKLDEHIKIQACACLNIKFFKIPPLWKRDKVLSDLSPSKFITVKFIYIFHELGHRSHPAKSPAQSKFMLTQKPYRQVSTAPNFLWRSPLIEKVTKLVYTWDYHYVIIKVCSLTLLLQRKSF